MKIGDYVTIPEWGNMMGKISYINDGYIYVDSPISGAIYMCLKDEFKMATMEEIVAYVLEN